MIIIIPLVILVLASFIVPAIATFITSKILGKTAELNVDDQLGIAGYYYLICGLIFATAMVMEAKSSLTAEVLMFLGMFFLWPLGLSFAFLGHEDGGAAMVWGGLIGAFVFTQVICIFKVLKRAQSKTESLDEN